MEFGPAVPHDPFAVRLNYPPTRPRGRGAGMLLLVLLVGLWAAASSAVSYYVDSLWFASLGYEAVFWKSLNIQGLVFSAFAGITFVVLYGAFLALKPARFGEFGTGGVVIISGRPVSLPVGPLLRVLGIVLSIIAALAAGAAMMADCSGVPLWWDAGHAGAGSAAPRGGWLKNPVCGR